MESRRDAKEAEQQLECTVREQECQRQRAHSKHKLDSRDDPVQQSADKRAAWRRSFTPDVIVMYDHGHDMCGRSYKQLIAALKHPLVHGL